jgi:hypothetical protein
MKNVFFIFSICFLISAQPLLAVGPYAVGDKLTVLAESGLILRQTAAPTGTKIKTLDYGTLVTILADNFKKVPYSVAFFSGFTVKGFWVKVRTPEGQEGFVFDGYLSKYKTPGSLPNGDDPNAADNDAGTIQERYLMMHSARKGKRIDLPKGPGRYEQYRVVMVNGDELEVNTGEGGSSYTIRFHKGVTMEEAYLIGKSLWLEDVEKIKTSISKGVVTMLSDDEMYSVDIENKGGFVYLTMQHAD